MSSNSVFRDYFIDTNEDELNFEISSRGGINFEVIQKKIKDFKIEPFIVDISINGYSNKDTFDFKLGDKTWSDIKNVFTKGESAQKDPEALTIKRAIRLCARDTTRYIRARKIKTNLAKFSDIVPNEYAHLGGHFVVDKNNALNLLQLWKNFDSSRKTNIYSTVLNILRLRFPELFIDYKERS